MLKTSSTCQSDLLGCSPPSLLHKLGQILAMVDTKIHLPRSTFFLGGMIVCVGGCTWCCRAAVELLVGRHSNIARICAAKHRAVRLACQGSKKLVPLHPQPAQAIFSLYFQHGLKLYTTLAQRSEPLTQHGGQQEHWAYRYGRHGQDVCPAVEQRWLEVSTSRDNLDSLASSFALW
jgi:hypothetical protein